MKALRFHAAEDLRVEDIAPLPAADRLGLVDLRTRPLGNRGSLGRKRAAHEVAALGSSLRPQHGPTREWHGCRAEIPRAPIAGPTRFVVTFAS